jgi:hypothetical protein
MTLSQDGFAQGLTAPIIGPVAIAPSDSVDLPRLTRQIRVTGAGGAVAVVWADGAETVEPVAAGEILDWRIRRIRATGTTATGLRGYY